MNLSKTRAEEKDIRKKERNGRIINTRIREEKANRKKKEEKKWRKK